MGKTGSDGTIGAVETAFEIVETLESEGTPSTTAVDIGSVYSF